MIMPHSESDKDYWQRIEEERRKVLARELYQRPADRNEIFRNVDESRDYISSPPRIPQPPPPPPPAPTYHAPPPYEQWSYAPPPYHHHHPGYAPPSTPYMYHQSQVAYYTPPRPFEPAPPVARRPHDELIYELRDEDVLCGRGAPTNMHPGNQYFRQLISEYQMMYLAAKRVDKPEIALLIVEKIKERGGRFLKRTKRGGLGPTGHFCWQEVGGERSYEKTCQSLREGAPEIRKRMAIKELTGTVDSTDYRDEENTRENRQS